MDLPKFDLSGIIAIILIAFLMLAYVASTLMFLAGGCVPLVKSPYWILGAILFFAIPAIAYWKFGLIPAMSILMFNACILLAILLFWGTFIQSVACDYKKTESDAYWRLEARPFAILESAQGGNTLKLVVQNAGDASFELNKIDVAGQGAAGRLSPSQPIFKGGEKKIVSVIIPSDCTSGDQYEYWVNITYSESGSSEQKTEVGAKPLVGKCYSD